MGLVLGRYADQKVILRDQISGSETEITFMKSKGNQIRISIKAPATVSIKRPEKCQPGAKVSESDTLSAKVMPEVMPEVS